MDTIENLIIAIVKPLISQPDALTIKIEDTPEFLEYHLNLDQSDVGRVIGRKGRTISAIRTIVYSVPTEYKKVRIVIDEKWLFVNCSGLKSAKLEKGQILSFLF
ncbi:KH domain-containing protein [Streptococcus pneumoniae]|nr:KH domain-containing protein [Streptococcus pneumoniae]